MNTSRGSLYRLDTVDQKFVPVKILNLNNAPEACAVYGDKILIASYQNFYAVRNFRKEQFVTDAFWGGLYPNSISAFDDENIVIGMRGRFVELNLKTKAIKLYRYDE